VGRVGWAAVEEVAEVAVEALEDHVDVGGAEAVDDVLEATFFGWVFFVGAFFFFVGVSARGQSWKK
jgi:hypothetical protein